MSNSIYISTSNSAKPVIMSVDAVGRNKMIVTPFPTGGNPTVDDWADRVVANGGAAPSIDTKNALATFHDGLTTDGLISSMISVCCFVPDNLIASITPLIVEAGNDPWTNNNFVGGDLTVNGLTGNTSNKYLNTGCNPSTIYASANDGGATFYASSGVNANQYRMIATNGSNFFGLYCDGASTNTGLYGGWNLSGPIPIVNYGFYSANRTAANACAIYEANSITAFNVKASNSGAPGTRPNLNLYCFCWNNNGSPTTFPSATTTLSFAAIHNALTQTQANNLFNRVQTLRQTLGGGYT